MTALRCLLRLHRYRFALCNEGCRTYCRTPCVARCERCGKEPNWTWYFGRGGHQ